MATILLSIKPEYVDKIFTRTKKYEYRKRLSQLPVDKIIVYSTDPIKDGVCAKNHVRKTRINHQSLP